MSTSEKKEKMSGKPPATVVFRYERELLTFYNKSVKRFFTMLAFVFALINLLKLFHNRGDFMEEIPYVALGTAFLIGFWYYLYRNTKAITQEHLRFVKNPPRKGKIVDMYVEPDEKGRAHAGLIVEYTPKGQSSPRRIKTPYVIGNPYELLDSLGVTVYEDGDETYVTDFKVKEVSGKEKE